MMKRHHFVLIGMLLLSMGLFAKEYPEWFLYPHKYPQVIVGYNYRGTDPFKDAAMNYCIYKKCFVFGEQHYYSDTEKKFSDYYYYCDSELFDLIIDSLKHQHSYMLNTLTKDHITAFTLKNENLDEIIVDTDLFTFPEWTDQVFYRQGAYYYGVGVYTSRGNDPDAWKTAEEESIFAIMTGYHINLESIKNIYQDDENDYFSYEQIIKFEYELNNIEIIGRYDKDNEQLFYVLSRIHVNDIKKIGEYYEK